MSCTWKRSSARARPSPRTRGKLSALVKRPRVVSPRPRQQGTTARGRTRRHVPARDERGVRGASLVAVRGRSGSGKSTLLSTSSPASTSPRRAKSGLRDVPEPPLPRRAKRSSACDQPRLRLPVLNSNPHAERLRERAAPGPSSGGAPRRTRAARPRASSPRSASRTRATFRTASPGCEQQRVAIARGLRAGPTPSPRREPTGNLDDATGRR